MSKKHYLWMIMLIIGTLAMSGCVDLFAVPGIAVSPDGSKIYFLTTSNGEMDGEDLQLASVSVGGTEITNITAAFGGFGVGGFAVNPVSGDVAFASGVDAGDGTQTTFIAMYKAGEATLFVGPEAFEGANYLPTQMAFSPDGNTLAMTGIKFPVGVDLSQFNSDSELPADVLSQLQSIVYIADVNTGLVTTVSDGAAVWANTLVWSPDSQNLAFNAWVDTNADGNISISGGFASFASGDFGAQPDLSHIFIYNVGSGSTTQIESTETTYGQAFVSNSQIAYIELPAMALMGAGGANISVYDLGSGTSTQVHETVSTILGIALSPDGSRVAWTQVAAESDDEGNTPNELYVANPDFSDPTLLYTATPDQIVGYADAPVWNPNGSGIFLTSSNILSSVLGSMTMGFGAMASEFGGEAATEDMFLPQVLLIDSTTGTATTAYTGVVMNPSFFAAVIGLSEGNSMESMFDSGYGDG